MKTKPRYVVDQNGKQVAVILELRAYEHLPEDLDDLRTLAQRRREPSVPLAQFEARMKKRGLL